VQNTYPGFFTQMETVTARVTDATGHLVNEGIVTFQVNGQTMVAGVHNGVATVTFATPMFNFAILVDLFFAHTLTANYTDPGGSFGPSSAAVTEQAILLDLIDFLLATEFASIAQFQVR
jgi:hypothetical protein